MRSRNSLHVAIAHFVDEDGDLRMLLKGVRLMTYGLALVLLALSSGSAHGQTATWEKTSGPLGGNVYKVLVVEGGYRFISTDSGVYRRSNIEPEWSEVSGPMIFERVEDLDLASDGALLATSTGARRVYRSTDLGDTWVEITPSLDSRYPTTLSVSSSGKIFLGTNQDVAYSTNQGASWEWSSEGLPASRVRDFAFLADGTVLLGCEEGLLSSSDGGGSWSAVESDLPLGPVLGMTVTPAGKLLAGVEGEGLFASVDGGISWQRMEVGEGYSNPRFDTIVLGPTGTIWVSGAGFHRSTDEGETWVTIRPPVEPFDVAEEANGGLILATMFGVLFSANGESNWSEMNGGLKVTKAMDLATAANDLLFAATRSGLYKSSSRGDSWVELRDAYGGIYAEALMVSADGRIHVGSFNAVRVSPDQGRTWHRGEGLDPFTNFKGFAEDAEGNVYAATDELGVVRSTDQGTIWESFENDLFDLRVHSVTTNGDGDVFASAYSNGVFRSEDKGETWQEVNEGLEGNFSTRKILATSSGSLLVLKIPGYLYRSTNKGDSWVKITDGYYQSSAQELLEGPDQTLFVGGSQGVHCSFDDGESWKFIDHGGSLPPSLYSLAIDSEKYLYAGPWSQSVWRTTEPFECNVPVLVSSIQAVPKEDGIVIRWQPLPDAFSRFYIERANGAHAEASFRRLNRDSPIPGWGPWEYEDTGVEQGMEYTYRLVGVTESDEELTFGPVTVSVDPISSAAIQSTYPNPSRGETWVVFQMSQIAEAALTVCDASGRMVSTILRGRRDAGSYQVVWDGRADAGREAPPGIYFIRLVMSGRVVDSRKMVLTR